MPPLVRVRLRAISAPFSEAVIFLAAIIAAGLVATAILYATGIVGSNVKGTALDVAKLVSTRIAFVDYYVNQSNDCHYVFLKNVGRLTIDDFDRITISLGNATEMFILRYGGYNVTPNPGFWSYVDIENPNRLWEMGETLELILCPPAKLYAPYKLTLALPNGAVFEVTYGGG